MSDPVTNMEIEDVLSSIRRLVAQDGGAGRVATASPAMTGAATKDVPDQEQDVSANSVDSLRDREAEPADDTVSNALLLTHALRVVEPDAHSAPEHHTEALLLSEDLVLVDADHDAPEGASEAQDTPPEQEPPAETADAEDAARKDDTVHHDLSIAAALIDDTAGAVPEETLQLPEADTPEHETHAADEAQTVDQNDRLSDEEHTLLPEADAVPLEQKIAELEELIGRSEGQWEPDGDEVESTTSEALPWADDAPSEDLKVHRAQPIVPPQTVDAAPEKPVQDGPDADALRAAVREALHDEVGAMEQDWSDIAQENLEMPTLDEDGLRDLVADIVRQELQGALGERITRNVRKLVRREIYRAMATNELD